MKPDREQRAESRANVIELISYEKTERQLDEYKGFPNVIEISEPRRDYSISTYV